MSWDFSDLELPKKPFTYKYNKIRHWTSLLAVLYLITSSLLGVFKDLFPSVLFYSILFFIPLFIWATIFAISYVINTSYDAKVIAITETNIKKNENIKNWIKDELWFYFNDFLFAEHINIFTFKRKTEVNFQRKFFYDIKAELDKFLFELLEILSLYFQDKNIEFHISSSDRDLTTVIVKTLKKFINSNSLKNWSYSLTDDWETELNNIFDSSSFHAFIDLHGRNSSCFNESISWFVCSNEKVGKIHDLVPSARLLRPNILDQKMTIKDQLFQVLNEQLDNEYFELWMDQCQYNSEIISGLLEKNPSFELDQKIHKWSLVNGNNDNNNYLNFISFINNYCRENNILITDKSIYTIKAL